MSGESDGEQEKRLEVEENSIEDGKGRGIDASIEGTRLKQRDRGYQRHCCTD